MLELRETVPPEKPPGDVDRPQSWPPDGMAQGGGEALPRLYEYQNERAGFGPRCGADHSEYDKAEDCLTEKEKKG